MADRRTENVAHRQWWQIFEVIFGLSFLVAIALQRLLPWSLPGIFQARVRLAPGVLLIVLGLLCIVLARRELARQNQPTDPGQPTSRLVTSGIFGLSRNPLYLGGVCIVLGIALAWHLP